MVNKWWLLVCIVLSAVCAGARVVDEGAPAGRMLRHDEDASPVVKMPKRELRASKIVALVCASVIFAGFVLTAFISCAIGKCVCDDLTNFGLWGNSVTDV